MRIYMGGGHRRLFSSLGGYVLIQEIRLSLTTLREFTMLQIMNTLTDKPGWEEKVRSHDPLL